MVIRPLLTCLKSSVVTSEVLVRGALGNKGVPSIREVGVYSCSVVCAGAAVGGWGRCHRSSAGVPAPGLPAQQAPAAHGGPGCSGNGPDPALPGRAAPCLALLKSVLGGRGGGVGRASLVGLHPALHS